jgi:hypothetical protein
MSIYQTFQLTYDGVVYRIRVDIEQKAVIEAYTYDDTAEDWTPFNIGTAGDRLLIEVDKAIARNRKMREKLGTQTRRCEDSTKDYLF